MIEKRIEKYWCGRANGFSQKVQEEMSSPRKKAWQESIAGLAGEGKGQEALDLGTGPGFFAILLGELGYRVTGVDCSVGMLEEARANTRVAGTQAELIQGDVQKLPFPGESFGLVISRNLVWNLSRPLDAFREWHRVLKKGGRVLVFDADYYGYLKNPLLREKWELCQKRAREGGYQGTVSQEKLQECEAIARELPLTYQHRPQWDVEALAHCGFSNIQVENNINAKVYDQARQVLNAANPMFVVAGTR